MDIISHALWGGIAFGRDSRRRYLSAAGFSLLPDLVGEGITGLLTVLGVPGMPDWSGGHPDLGDFPAWAQTFYSASHSLVVVALVFGLTWALRRRRGGRPPWLLGAWALHILIDIPTHSLAMFATPFLWPLSPWRVDGWPWRTPTVLVVNALLLLTVHALWLRSRKSA